MIAVSSWIRAFQYGWGKLLHKSGRDTHGTWRGQSWLEGKCGQIKWVQPTVYQALNRLVDGAYISDRIDYCKCFSLCPLPPPKKIPSNTGNEGHCAVMCWGGGVGVRGQTTKYSLCFLGPEAGCYEPGSSAGAMALCIAV